MKRITRWLAAMALSMAGAVQANSIVYYHNDLAGSPVAATNEAGALLWKEKYRPYGERLNHSPGSAENKVWFTSRRQDLETGLVYMGARYYDPVLGRFTSVDPVGFDEQNVHSHNRYAYANNNPYKYVDPDGASAVHVARLVGTGTFQIATRLGARALGERLGLALWVMTQATADSEGAKQGSSGGAQGQEKPSLVEPDRATHILGGDKTGGGHRHGSGKKGKTEFPSGWSDEKILGEISDVATDPASNVRPGSRAGREVRSGTRDGVNIDVVVDDKKGIVSGWPTNVPRNP